MNKNEKRRIKYNLKKVIPRMTNIEKGDLVKVLFLKGFTTRELAPLFETEIVHVANFLIELGIYKKSCTKCKIEKSYLEFCEDKSRADRLHYICRSCFLIRFKKHYPKDRNKLLKTSSDWYYNNIDKARENHKRWRKDNPYYDEKRAKVPVWADKDKMNQIYLEAKRLTEETGIVYEVDHIIPINHPDVCGLHVEGNLQVLPMVENRRKHNDFNSEIFNGKTVGSSDIQERSIQNESNVYTSG